MSLREAWEVEWLRFGVCLDPREQGRNEGEREREESKRISSAGTI